MDDIKIPKLTEFCRTQTLKGGKVETAIYLFMLDADIFINICCSFIRGEISMLECRKGTALKHPKDKYDKVVGMSEARKRLKKEKMKIKYIQTNHGKSIITLENDMYVMLNNDKITVGIL
jgi:hypothetical protein